jgi:hypothetical protein
MIQSRRMTEGSIAQGSALAAAESYMEQMRGMSLASLVNSGGLLDTAQNPLPNLSASYQILTELDNVTTDSLWTSTGTPPDIGAAGFTPGNTPAGVVNNLKDIPADPLNVGSQLSWNASTTIGSTTFAAVWPGANNYADGSGTAFTAPMQKNIHVDFWVWIKDISVGTGLPAAQHNAYSITLIYTWKFWDGLEWQSFTGCLRTIRSVVPTWNK